MSRHFSNASGAYIRFAPGPLATVPVTAITMAMVVKFTAIGYRVYCGIETSDGTPRWRFDANIDGIRLYDGFTTANPGVGFELNEWGLVTCRRAAGTDTLSTWTYYYWDNGSLVSTERFEVLNDRPAPGTDGRYFIGTSGGEAFDADVAAVAIWDRKLTQAETVDLVGGNWITSDPVWLVEFPPWEESAGVAVDLGPHSLAPLVNATVISADPGPPWFVFSTSPPPTITQEGFRWRNDDGSETSATWKTAQDTNSSLSAVGQQARLRVLLDAVGDPDPTAYKLFFKKTTDSPWLPVPVGAGPAPPESAYRYYRWSVGTRKQPNISGFEASEFQMLVGGSRVAAVSVNGITTPSAQNAACLNDNSTATKYYTDVASYTEVVQLVFDYGTPIAATSYRWYTADLDGRAPVTWDVWGSNDASTWRLLDSRVGYATTGSSNTLVGTFTFNNPTIPASPYIRYLKWTTTKRREASSQQQLSEWAVTVDGVRVPAGYVIDQYRGTAGGGAEDIEWINDGTTATKWYMGGLASQTAPVEAIFDYGYSNVAPTAYYWYTGNDSPDRDPVSWTLHCSEDLTTWTLLDTQTDLVGATSRLVQVGPFAITTEAGTTSGGPVYIAPSSNITAGGQATTALLTPPTGKTTAAFSTGRMWDDENGTDLVDIGPWSPNTVPDIVGWWDASDASTFTFSSSTIASQWRDKSPNGRHFAQATTGNQPNRNGTQNGLTSLVFDGSNDYMDTASFTVAQPMTIFLALNGGTDNVQSWFSSVGNPLQIYGSPHLSMFVNPNEINGSFGVGGGVNLWRFVANGSSSSIYRDGSSFASGTVGTTSVTTGFRLAERNLTGSYVIKGSLFEIIVYSRVLTGGEITDVETYLADKWGI